MPRHFPREVEYFQHRRTFPDNSVEFEVAQQLFFEGSHAAALIVQRRGFFQRSRHSRAIDRFRQKVRCASPDGIQRGVQRVVTSHDDDVHAGIAPQRLIEKFVAVHARHVYVREDHAATTGSNQLQGLFRIGCRNRFVPE